jgi:hypothetical protein
MVSITHNAEAVASSLESRSQRVLAELGRGMQRAMLMLARYAGTPNLVGQSPTTQTSGTTVTGLASAVLFHRYGRVWEERAHLPEARLRPSAPQKRRMAHRVFDLPARSFLRTSLERQRAAIVAELQQAVRRGLA